MSAELLRKAAETLQAVTDDVAPRRELWPHLSSAYGHLSEVNRFIQAMNPAVAQGLVSWLEAVAARWALASSPRTSRERKDALGIARAILGEVPDAR